VAANGNPMRRVRAAHAQAPVWLKNRASSGKVRVLFLAPAGSPDGKK